MRISHVSLMAWIGMLNRAPCSLTTSTSVTGALGSSSSPSATSSFSSSDMMKAKARDCATRRDADYTKRACCKLATSGQQVTDNDASSRRFGIPPRHVPSSAHDEGTKGAAARAAVEAELLSYF